MKSNIFKTLAVSAVAVLALAGCKDDHYTSRGDLFQPRFANSPEVTIINHNDMGLIWYKVNDAVDYTVQLYHDNLYRNLAMEFDTTEPYFNLYDLPYSKAYYVRVRSNAANPENNSAWATCSFTTETRPEYAHLLQRVSKAEIEDNQATIRWMVDAENPVDSFSVVPTMNENVATITGYVPAEARESGELVVKDLAPSTLYTVNIYNTAHKRIHDKPYNEVTFRTTGPAAQVINVGITDNLSDILNTNNTDPDIPEGVQYVLEPGTSYTIAPFAIRKGFSIVCPDEGVSPVLICNGTWNITEGAYIEALTFENIEFRNAAVNQYFMNIGNPYTLESITFNGCTFRNIYRGFWRHQGKNVKKIESFEMNNCWFDQCGWQGSTYGTFNFGSAGKNETADYDQIEVLTIRNTTFSRGGSSIDATWGWGNLVEHSSTFTPIELTLENVTIYDFCVNNRLINISSTEYSTVNIRGVIVASPSGELIRLGIGTRTNYDNNYVTTDYKMGGARINATELPQSAAELFENPENGDYTLKVPSSLPYITRAGDLRWIP